MIFSGLPLASFLTCSRITSRSCSTISVGTSSRLTATGFIAATCIATSRATSSLAPFNVTTAVIDPFICEYIPNTSSSFLVILEKRLKEIFSPIVAVASIISCESVLPLFIFTSRASSVVFA